MFLQINFSLLIIIINNSEGTKPFLSLWGSQIIVQFSKRGSRPFTRTWTERECGKELHKGINVWKGLGTTYVRNFSHLLSVWGRLSAGICSHLDFQRCKIPHQQHSHLEDHRNKSRWLVEYRVFQIQHLINYDSWISLNWKGGSAKLPPAYAPEQD